LLLFAWLIHKLSERAWTIQPAQLPKAVAMEYADIAAPVKVPRIATGMRNVARIVNVRMALNFVRNLCRPISSL